MEDRVNILKSLDEISRDHTMLLTPYEAFLFASQEQSYNSLAREKVMEMVDSINREFPRRPNGEFAHSWHVGNEGGSRVYYLTVHYNDIRGIVDEVTQMVQRHAEKAECDEFLIEHGEITMNREFRARIWWD